MNQINLRIGPAVLQQFTDAHRVDMPVTAHSPLVAQMTAYPPSITAHPLPN
jgi:hypothetical protein